MIEPSTRRSLTPSGRGTVSRAIAVLALIGALTSCGAPERPRANRLRNSGAVTFESLAPDVYRPCGIAPARDAVWVLACSGKAVRIGPGGDRIARTIDGEIVGLDSLSGDGSGSLWVITAKGSGSARRGAVIPLDASAAAAGASVDLGASIPMHATSLDGTPWVATIDGGLFELTGNAAKRAASGPPLVWIVGDGSTMWTVAENGDVVERTGDGTETRRYSGVLPNTIAAAAGQGNVWLSAENGLVRIDRSTGTASRVDVTGTVNHIESCAGSVWLSQPDFGLRSVDASGTVLRSIRLDVAPSYLACDGTTLWILSEDGRLASIDLAK